VREPSSNQFVDDEPQREDIGARRRVLAPPQLGGHVDRRAGHGAGAREDGTRDFAGGWRLHGGGGRGVSGGPLGMVRLELREAEVEQLDLAPVGQDHVAGLDVAMKHALGVRGLEPAGHSQRASRRKRSRARGLGSGAAMNWSHAAVERDVATQVDATHTARADRPEHRESIKRGRGRPIRGLALRSQRLDHTATTLTLPCTHHQAIRDERGRSCLRSNPG
jgi:hypothetical protein